MAQLRDEYGNPVQLTDQHGHPVQLTDEFGNPMHLTGVATSHPPATTTVQSLLHGDAPPNSATTNTTGVGGAGATPGITVYEQHGPRGMTGGAPFTHQVKGATLGVAPSRATPNLTGATHQPGVTRQAGGLMAGATHQPGVTRQAGGFVAGGEQEQLRRSGSSSSSSEDDGEGGRRRRKKGLTQKIKEKLGGGKHGTETVEGTGQQSQHRHEKKGVMEKIKEKLPGVGAGYHSH